MSNPLSNFFANWSSPMLSPVDLATLCAPIHNPKERQRRIDRKMKEIRQNVKDKWHITVANIDHMKMQRETRAEIVVGDF